MKKITLTLLTILSILAPVITVQSFAQEVEAKPYKQKQCFETSRTTIYVPYLLTKEQKKTLMMIKANSMVIDNMRVAFSLENNFIKCEKQNRSFENGFAKYTARTLVAYPSFATYTALKKRIVLINYEPRIILNADVQVGVGYSPEKGYSASATITPILK
jgi:hypothetical protein